MTDTSNDDDLTLWERIQAQAIILGGFIAIFWGLEIIDQLIFAQALDQYGIRPRRVSGLWGIFFAPFLHGNYAHVASNSLPFMVMGWLILLRSISQFFIALLMITVMAGAGVWLIGASNSVHIGASGVVFGFLGFLIVAGIREQSLKAIISAILVGILYGSFIWGILPNQQGISWEGHLFGLIGGGMTAHWIVEDPDDENKS